MCWLIIILLTKFVIYFVYYAKHVKRVVVKLIMFSVHLQFKAMMDNVTL